MKVKERERERERRETSGQSNIISKGLPRVVGRVCHPSVWDAREREIKTERGRSICCGIPCADPAMASCERQRTDDREGESLDGVMEEMRRECDSGRVVPDVDRFRACACVLTSSDAFPHSRQRASLEARSLSSELLDEDEDDR